MLKYIIKQLEGRYLSLIRMRQQGSGEEYMTMSFMICTAHQMLLRRSNQEE